MDDKLEELELEVEVELESKLLRRGGLEFDFLLVADEGGRGVGDCPIGNFKSTLIAEIKGVTESLARGS